MYEIFAWANEFLRHNSPRLAVMSSWSLGFFFLGRPFCRGGGAEVPLKKDPLGTSGSTRANSGDGYGG